MRPWIKFIFLHIEFNAHGTVRNLGDSVRLALQLWPEVPVREDLADVLWMSQFEGMLEAP